MKKKLLYLESLRGLAALTVAVYHFPSTSILYSNSFTLNGYTMVDFFFVLSGFVIAYNYSNQIYSAKDLLHFQAKRFFRLYPLHFTVLLGFVVIEFSKYLFEQKTGIVANNPAFSSNDEFAFVNQLLLTHALVGLGSTFNYPSWSISTEFYTYLLFGIVVWLFRNISVLLYLLIILVSGVVVYYNNAFSESDQLAILRCAFFFFSGVIVCRISELAQTRISGVWSSILFVLMLIIVCYLDKIPNFILSIIFGGLILSLVISKDNVIKRALSNKYFVFLGTISYGIYMVHAAVWWGLTQVLRFIFDVEILTIDGARSFINLDAGLATSLTVFGLIVILALASLSYRLVEAPFNRFRHKVLRSRSEAVKTLPPYRESSSTMSRL